MPVLILTEGPEDCHTIRNLIQSSGLGSAAFFSNSRPLAEDYVLRYLGGYETLRKNLGAELATEFSHIAVVIDFDEAKNHRWQSITDKLKEVAEVLGFAMPLIGSGPSPDGDVLHAGTKVIGLWLWPDNQSEGDMETFAATLVGDDPLWSHARTTVENLPERRFKNSHLPKANLHTWLAWQNEPGQQIGEAIRDGKLRCSEAAAQAFLGWLKKLRDTPL